MSIAYPIVRSEEETLRLIKDFACSIARFGDGEFNLVKGGNCVSQVANPKLAAELKNILKSAQDEDGCIVAIPNMTTLCPKTHWQKNKHQYASFLNPKCDAFTYGSSFITRPDSAPWIDTDEYWDDVESLWKDQSVILVSCGERSLTPANMLSAGYIHEVRCPRRDAYSVIDDLEGQIKRLLVSNKDVARVIMCAGATATCLAWRLQNHCQALDLGHIGMFMRREKS